MPRRRRPGKPPRHPGVSGSRNGNTPPPSPPRGIPAQDRSTARSEKTQTEPDRQVAQAGQLAHTVSRFEQFDPRGLNQRNAIHDLARRAYQSPDASPESLSRAYEADREAEHQRYRDQGILSERASPTESAVNRAVESTWGTRNATMMAEVLRSKPRVQESYRHNHFGYGGLQLRRTPDDLDASDPRHTDRRYAENWNSVIEGDAQGPVPTYNRSEERSPATDPSAEMRRSPPPTFRQGESPPGYSDPSE